MALELDGRGILKHRQPRRGRMTHPGGEAVSNGREKYIVAAE
jgi:hypothetical protein